MTTEDDLPERMDAFLRQLEKKIGKEGQWLSPQELEALRAIAEYRQEIVSQFKYRRAVRLIMSEWRALIVGVAAFLGVIVAFRDDLLTLFNLWKSKE